MFAFDNEIPSADADMAITDSTPTVYEYADLSPEQQGRIIRLINDIGVAWSVVSPASPFPSKYHPDPDTHNWGISLLSAICGLAQMTQLQGLQEQAVGYVSRSIVERNMGLEPIEGDYVIRPEDVNFAIHKMRNRVDSYRPRDRRGNRRGRGRRVVRDRRRRD